ncbi:acyl-CoA-binding protein [Taibaiella koreensis]|uniref:acyl-CoA-binding protein n=1 Tax=Taibaiella koreensis TaxID=1268548 RepID=UPI000E59A8B5|nr:acyl-CoA-binding protein [Taibaiella koreensis]
MAIITEFEAAVAASKTLPEKPDNDTLLQLYSLYKQATEGDAPDKGDYGTFDFVAKAKHEAWRRQQGVAKDAAKQQYIALVNQLAQ